MTPLISLLSNQNTGSSSGSGESQAKEATIVVTGDIAKTDISSFSYGTLDLEGVRSPEEWDSDLNSDGSFSIFLNTGKKSISVKEVETGLGSFTINVSSETEVTFGELSTDAEFIVTNLQADLPRNRSRR